MGEVTGVDAFDSLHPKDKFAVRKYFFNMHIDNFDKTRQRYLTEIDSTRAKLIKAEQELEMYKAFIGKINPNFKETT